MSQLLVRNLSPETIEKLKRRAQTNHRSLQAEAAFILEQAANIQAIDFWHNAKQIREQLMQSGKVFSDSGELLHEERSL